MAYLHDSRRSSTEKGKEQKDYEQGYVSVCLLMKTTGYCSNVNRRWYDTYVFWPGLK